MVFLNMHQRCLNPKSPSYGRYGARGIGICDRWLHRFSNFLADMGVCPVGYSIERIDNNGHYEPENCRWATSKEQQYNRSNTIKLSMNGDTYTIHSFSQIYGVPLELVRSRLRVGWTPSEIISGARNPSKKKAPRHAPSLTLSTITRQERRLLAIELRALGESFRVIGELLGVSHQAARQLINYQPQIPKDSWRKRLRRERAAGRE